MRIRTGLQTFLRLAHKICVLFGVWRGPILAAIDANTSATTEQKNQLKSLITAVDTACLAIDAMRTVWE